MVTCPPPTDHAEGAILSASQCLLVSESSSERTPLSAKPAAPIDSLPNELLRHVFEFLHYYDLKTRVPLVCRRFRRLIDTESARGRIDRLLFRDLPTTPSPDIEYTPHPAFAAFESEIVKIWLDDVYFIHKRTSRRIKLTETNLANENVISPAADALVFHIGPKPGALKRISVYVMSSRKGQGVSVLDVMSEFVESQWGAVSSGRWDNGPQSPDGVEWEGVKKIEVEGEGGVVNMYF